MRFCWNDSFQGPLRNISLEEAQFIYSIGFRVAGINAGDTEATDSDIEHAKSIFREAGLIPGPYGLSCSAIRPDKDEQKEHKKKIAKALSIAGKLGCTALRYSVGSMHPTNIWMHHPENITQRALDELIESTLDLVPVAEDANCMLCPETTQWTIVNNIDRMAEFVDRLDSPYASIVLDPVNHMTYDRIYDSGRWVKCAVGFLGDRIGEFHVKDVIVADKLLVSHIDETPMGTGVFDHEALIRVSSQLEGWKTFSLEHIADRNLIKPAYNHIQGIADRIGHNWTDPGCTRNRWEQGRCK